MTTRNARHSDVILVPYPISGVTTTKRRPAVVMSSDHYNTSTGEVMIAPITSRGNSMPRVGDYSIVDWRQSGLLGPATVRSRIITIRASHVLKVLGSLTRRDVDGLAGWIRRVLDL